MKRKQKILVSAITTLLGGTALSLSAAAAVIDITGDSTTAATLATYATEIKASSTLEYTLPVIAVNLGGPVSSTTVAIPANETRYVRVTLTNATIGTDTPYIAGLTAVTDAAALTANGSVDTNHCPLLAEQTGATPTLSPMDTTTHIALAQGGANQTYVTFSLKSASTDVNGLYSAGCRLAIDLHKVKVTTPGQPVKLTYGLFSGPIAAANNTLPDTRGMNKQDITAVQFAPALVFKANSLGKDAVPSVATQFKLFKEGAENTSADQKKASAGAFDFKVVDPNVLGADGNAITSVSALLADATKLKIEGDFAGIRATGTDSAYFLSDTASCGTISAAGTPDYGTNSATALSSVPLSVSFGLTDATALSSGIIFFCAGLGELNPTPFDSTKTDGVAITDSNGIFKVTLVPEAQTNYSVTSRVENLKAIKRDGVTLEAPFINIAPGYTSRILLAHYNKNATADTPFFIKIRGYDGDPQPVQILSEGTLKKGTTKKIMSTELFSVPAGAKTHVGVSVTFHGSSDDIQGVVQHINSTTGEVTSIPMIRPGGGR